LGYKEIRDAYKKKYKKSIKNSYIAQVKSLHGKTKGRSPKRKGDYKYPCPAEVKPKLEKLMKDLDAI